MLKAGLERALPSTLIKDSRRREGRKGYQPGKESKVKNRMFGYNYKDLN